MSDLTEKFKANEGYLNVALRGLCSQGWLTQHIDNTSDAIGYETNDKSEIAFGYFHLYEDATDLLKMSGNYHPRKFEVEPFQKLKSLYEKYKNNYGIALSNDQLRRSVEEQILTHIEGVIVGANHSPLGHYRHVSQILYGVQVQGRRIPRKPC